jgi:hypothetical protein
MDVGITEVKIKIIFLKYRDFCIFAAESRGIQF